MRQIKKHMAFIAVVFVFAAVASISMQASNSSGVQASPLALTPRAYLPVILKAAYFPNAGNVQFFKQARSDFDPHTTSPSPEIQAWMRDHYWRMLTYAPYFDTRLSWYPTAWAYKDLYGIYTDTNNLDSQYIINNHPEWILKDSNGNRLYINWGCHNSTCPQYAGDVGNPAFRTYWITQTSEILSNGYIGLFVDDVNLDWRISDGDNNFVTPIDPRTGTSMTLEDWQRYFAEFTEQIRMAFPNKEIVHNVIWYAGPTSNSFIRREIQAADYINLERGVNDGGLVGGNGNFGLETFFAYIDYVHSQNRRVLFLADKASAAEREYGLAGWLLISEGNDGFSNEQVSNPDNWWIGYELDLGAGFGTRYKWNSVIRRDFERGLVLLNQPHMPIRTIQLGQTYQTIEGNTVSSVTLDPATGVILRKP